MSLPIKIILSIILCLGLGFYSGYTAGSGTTDWYNTLNKPFFQPPSWLFGPAWTLLYTLMGIALALVWHSDRQAGKSAAITLFLVQLVFNLVWSPVFFRMHKIAIALGIIIALWFLIGLTIKTFKKFDTRAAWLLVPYLLWVTFATILNASIVYLN